MKIALLAGANSVHTLRWANGLSLFGHEVHLITQHGAVGAFSPTVSIHKFIFLGVFGYFLMVPRVRKLLRKIKPDILNAHYASGYGTTARLVGVSPYVMSAWGSDIFDFPHKSLFHKWIIRKNLTTADCVASTSKFMANEICKLVPEVSNIAITPFGVDLRSFGTVLRDLPSKNPTITIGTVKTMLPVYGIDTLIQAFALLVQSLRTSPTSSTSHLELRLVGGGAQTPELRRLAARLGVADRVNFVGFVPHSEVAIELAKFDVYVALSRMESFGVAVIEAGASGCPVVVSSVGGLAEVVVDGLTGIVVPPDDAEAAAIAIKNLVLNDTLRLKMGRAAKAHVAKHYSWDASVKTMIALYERTILQNG